MSKKSELQAKLDNLGLVCDVAESEQYLVYLANPLNMYPSVQLRVVGISAYSLTKIVVGFFAAMEQEYEQWSVLTAESVIHARLFTCVVNACGILNNKSEVHISAAPFHEFNSMSGVTVEKSYDATDKLYPRPTINIYSAGVFSTGGYATELIFPE